MRGRSTTAIGLWRGLFFLGLLNVVWQGLVIAEARSFYEKKDTFAETLVEVRATYQAWLQDDTAGGAFTLGPWYATNAMSAKSFSTVLFPEREPGANVLAGKRARYWKKHPEWVEGAVQPLRAGGNEATYLFRTIKAKAAISLDASLGSDDGIEVWLNGEKILSHDVPRTAAPDQERVKFALKAGENRLLMKIYNLGGGHGFYFSAGEAPMRDVEACLTRDFPLWMSRITQDLPQGGVMAWFALREDASVEQKMIASVLTSLGALKAGLAQELEAVIADSPAPGDVRWLTLYTRACEARHAKEILDRIDLVAVERAVRDLCATYPAQYGDIAVYEGRLAEYAKTRESLQQQLLVGEVESLVEKTKEFVYKIQEPLLANPLLDFEELMVVRRSMNRLGLPQNWQGNCSMPSTGYDNELVAFSLRGDAAPRHVFRPEGSRFVGDVRLHYEGGKFLFSMPGSHERWQIWEMAVDGSGLRQVTPGTHPEVDNYDACYLPDERIVFASTRCFHGIPCVAGSDAVANLCIMKPDGTAIRQLCFDQDHNWCPTVLNNGRVMYTRWEYSDTPHYFTRVLFHMNPDGTNQMEYYGSNSYWPNSLFYAKSIPDSPNKFVAIVTGHHGVPRMGELMLFDIAKGRFEGNGVVQRIPGYEKPVEPRIVDQLVNDSWPRFLHPCPLSEKYFLVSCQPAPNAPWGVYLVDVFDNMVLLYEEAGYALLEPTPIRKTPRPPVIPDKVRLDTDEATVYLSDIYTGEGLRGVPRGTVKQLRLYEFHYAYNKMGGHIHIGVEGPWDVHRILGTVPVYDDGSAYFKVPANMPIALQPLDAEGKAIQLMRSWFTAMPGEVLSCVGCHEKQSSTPLTRRSIASQQPPSAIAPWYGPARGFSFKREVQPVLNRHCVRCHNGGKRDDGRCIPDFSEKERNGWGNFTPSYLALHPYVRRPGPESDYHVLEPMEYHADTSELVQMLQKGHHGVQLEKESWDRVATWIDLNVPDHGTWQEQAKIPNAYDALRREMRTKYAGRPEDPESIIDRKPFSVLSPAMPGCAPSPCSTNDETVADGVNWPFDAVLAKGKQSHAERTLDLGDGVKMTLAWIPDGTFAMGDPDGPNDVRPRTVARLENPFWMGVTEVTNAQFQQFAPQHHNGYIDQHSKDHTRPGYAIDAPEMPAVRISWEQAMAFCAWLSEKTGMQCTLPTEAQWEWACRAGADTPMSYGDLNADFGPYANLADVSMARLAVHGIDPQPIKNPSCYQNFLPQEARFDDGERIMTKVAQYRPNPWGLFDMHGNAAEWTLSAYRPYPYDARDGRNAVACKERRVVRGGSWRDRPKRSTAAYRLPYQPWQAVFNVGFRVVCCDNPAVEKLAATK